MTVASGTRPLASNATELLNLLRYYGGYASALSGEGPESFDRVIDAAAEDPQRRVLVDLAAQTQGPLLRWIDEGGVADVAAELGVGLRYWHVMDSGRDSTHLLQRWLSSAATSQKGYSSLRSGWREASDE